MCLNDKCFSCLNFTWFVEYNVILHFELRSWLTSNCSFNTYLHIPFPIYLLMMTYFLPGEEKCKTCFHFISFDVEPYYYFVTTGHTQKLYACSTAYFDACFILALILFYYPLLYHLTDSQSSFTMPSLPCAKYLQRYARLLFILFALLLYTLSYPQ